MIRFIKGNIFDSNAKTLVNTVNCVGIMGKGLAKEFKLRFPSMYKEYVNACRRGELRSGRPFIYRDLVKNVLCFPTKDNWKGPSKYEFIEAGLKAIAENYEKWGLESLAVPPLGTGLGGLDWKRVKELVIKYLGHLPIDIEVYEPVGDPSVRVAPKHQRRINGSVKLTLTLVYVGELIRLARKMLPSNVVLGRLLIQKLAFFAQVAGVPMKLKFSGYEYGPFDYNLKHVIDRLEGLYIRDESTTWKRSNIHMLDEQEWVVQTQPYAKEMEEAHGKFLAAVDLISEHNALEETELLSTVLFAWCANVASGNLGTGEEIVDFVQEWKPNKFPSNRIQESLQQLERIGWLCFECNKPPASEPTEKFVPAIA